MWSHLNWTGLLFISWRDSRDAVYNLNIFRGFPLTPDIPRPNLILAADCVYFEPAFPLLVRTLSDLAETTTEVLFCYKKRRKVLPDLNLTCLFLYSLSARLTGVSSFYWERDSLGKRYLHASFPKSWIYTMLQVVDDPNRQTYTQEGISLLRLFKIKSGWKFELIWGYCSTWW